MILSSELESKFEKLIKSYPPGRHRAALIPMLLYAQDEGGAITEELVNEIAKRLGITPLQIGEVVTYYSMLHREPRGKYQIQICTNVSCMLLGGNELLEHAEQKLGIRRGETTADGQFSIEEVECMGACSWAPALQVNYDFHHFVTPEKLDRLIEDLRKVH
jgi:NADH-quinone oxidoreductase subunit E